MISTRGHGSFFVAWETAAPVVLRVSSGSPSPAPPPQPARTKSASTWTAHPDPTGDHVRAPNAGQEASSRLAPVSDARALVDEIARGGLAELHTHLGGSVDPAVMWTLAHEQGISLPVKDYWDFVELVTVDPRGVEGLPELDQIYKWTELIQSSPLAVERSVHHAIGGAYRTQNITTLELRFNPMKRNRGGERDLDHIIMAAVRGLDRAGLEYPRVRAGLILMMDRTFTRAQNEVIVEKAIRYRERGIVGLDIAGPRPNGGRYPYRELAPLVETARAAGLGITIHVGEEGGTDGIAEIGEVVEHLRPERIGHGILAAQDEETMVLLKDAGVVLEICPTSNLLTHALANEEALRDTVATFVDRGVAFTIATDGPEMMRTHLRDELQLLIELGVLGADALQSVNARGHEAAFVNRTI